MSRWVSVCTADELPPGHMAEWEDEYWIVMVANVDGRFFATQGNCGHANMHLAGCELEGQVVRCCQHNARFDVTTGEVVEPAEWYQVFARGAGCGEKPIPPVPTRQLRVYPVKVDDGTVWVEVPDPHPMAHLFQQPPESPRGRADRVRRERRRDSA